MTASSAIAELTAAELLELYQTKKLSPVEAAKACLARVRAHNDAVNAYRFVDEDTTLRLASESEARYLAGEPRGSLDGVPVAVKDVFLIKGWPTIKGSHAIARDQPWDIDAPAIAALRRNGFVPLGMTTTPEFGWKGVTDNPVDGVTRNPWDPSKTAGGSSGGSAAAVPLGMGPLALGTDAGGSIRIPAGFCGIVGHKPTMGRAPMWPPSAFAPLAHVGPMTWTVQDAALLLDVLTEPDSRDATLPANHSRFKDSLEGGIKGLRIAFSPRLGYVDIVEPEIAEAVASAARVFETLGARVEEVDPGFSDPLEMFDRMFYGGAANALRDLSDEQKSKMDPNLVLVAREASKLTMLEYLEASNLRLRLIERMSLFHTHYDLLLTPSLPIVAFEAGREVPAGWHSPRWPTWTPFTYPFNLTGQPACSVPCGFTSNKLPIGLQLVGAAHADDVVLRAAHAYQITRPLTDRRPTLHEAAQGTT